MAKPTHFLTLTLAGASGSDIAKRMERLAKRLRRKCGPVEWAWTVEPFVLGGLHVHAFVRAADEPLRREMPAAVQAVGMGFWHQIRPAAKFSKAYPLKMVLNGIEDVCQEYLGLNGGQLVHVSRDFWRDRAGNRIGRIRDAQKATRFMRRDTSVEGSSPLDSGANGDANGRSQPRGSRRVDQITHGDAESVGKTEEIAESHVALATLNLTDVRAV